MKMQYEIYENVTKAILDSVQAGDLVKCNGWKTPLEVKGVSANYFVMAEKIDGEQYYSICEKKPWPGIKHNAMTGGMFHISTDYWLFGWPGWEIGNSYDFDNKKKVEEYLQSLEKGETKLSERNGCPVHRIEIKRMERDAEQNSGGDLHA